MNISKIVTEMVRQVEKEIEEDMDMRLFNAPVECYTIMFEGWQREKAQLARKWEEELGVPWAEIYEEIQSRVSSKWLYYSGLSEFDPN